MISEVGFSRKDHRFRLLVGPGSSPISRHDMFVHAHCLRNGGRMSIRARSQHELAVRLRFDINFAVRFFSA